AEHDLAPAAVALGVHQLVERLLPLTGLFRIAVEGALRVRILIVDGHGGTFRQAGRSCQGNGKRHGQPCRPCTTRADLSLSLFHDTGAHPRPDRLSAPGPLAQLVERHVYTVDVAEGEIEWSPGDTALDPDALAGAEAVVALGGASVGRLPWTRGYRRQLVESRLDATNTLTTALRALRTDAPAFLSASAVGYYGSAPG
ncbi:unnamed protein product, partial [Penicillium discolor]